ncbi:hypothetical protein ACFVWX_01955 [Streptomyces sp. NPDC058220]|uniref:hypothetical protein n=1 Tax=unclassified Streptomyces TaxID=2593676 RepID=UPI0036542725
MTRSRSRSDLPSGDRAPSDRVPSADSVPSSRVAPKRLSVRTLPPPDLAEVRVIAASPDTAQLVADVLRTVFAATEPRSYPADRRRGGTRLHLTVDIGHPSASPNPNRGLRQGSALLHDDEI